MVKKQFIAYLLLGIISLQLLSLKELHQCFYNHQLVEDIQQMVDVDGKSAEGNEELKKNELFFSRSGLHFSFTDKVLLSTNASNNNYASRLADDAPTPPPIPSCS